MQMTDVKTWHNTRVFGKKKSMVENSGMMAVLTTESFTPIIEMDILGPDSYEPLGLSEDRFSQMSVGEFVQMLLHRRGSLLIARPLSLMWMQGHTLERQMQSSLAMNILVRCCWYLPRNMPCLESTSLPLPHVLLDQTCLV